MVEKRIIEAAASVAGRGIAGRKDQVSVIIEAAMSEAVRECYDRGIRDPAVIKAAQLDARQRAMDGIAAPLSPPKTD